MEDGITTVPFLIVEKVVVIRNVQAGGIPFYLPRFT